MELIISLFKSKRLSKNIKLNLNNDLIRSAMAYACPTLEFAPEAYQLKLQRLQNKILRTIGNSSSGASARDMHTAFHVPTFTIA
jgi:hypothetical protein